MDSEFFNGFLILFFPDRILKRTIREESAFMPLMSLLISSVFFASLGLYCVKKFIIIIANFKIHLPAALLIILCFYFIAIIVTAALSVFFDWIYTNTVIVKNNRVSANFLGNFLCHTYVFPLWVVVFFAYIMFPKASDSLIVNSLSLALVIRLLDIEARLIKIVYGLRLIQGYILVFMELILVLLGMGIGIFVSGAGFHK